MGPVAAAAPGAHALCVLGSLHVVRPVTGLWPLLSMQRVWTWRHSSARCMGAQGFCFLHVFSAPCHMRMLRCAILLA